ncbi:hypothetical protein ES705_34692 [subsurface metagenome]
MKCEVCDKDFKSTRATMCHIAAVHPTWLAERLALEEPDVETEPKINVEVVEVVEKKGFFDGFFGGFFNCPTLFDVLEDTE